MFRVVFPANQSVPGTESFGTKGGRHFHPPGSIILRAPQNILTVQFHILVEGEGDTFTALSAE
jgi:hypothetical protein